MKSASEGRGCFNRSYSSGESTTAARRPRTVIVWGPTVEAARISALNRAFAS